MTHYSHFPTRPALLEAVAQRVIGRGADAIAACDPAAGEPADALERLIDAAWGKLDRNLVLFSVGRDELSPEALRSAHEQLDEPILALIDRGRRSGSFRDDLPPSWMLATYYALMHAAAEETHGGRLSRDQALTSLKRTIAAAFRAQ